MPPKTCPHCAGWPTAEEVGLSSSRGGVRARVYEALRECRRLTIDEIRKTAWPDDKKRNEDSINILLQRMQEHLRGHGIVIVREIGHGTYRLGAA
jgi:hypothetical protein